MVVEPRNFTLPTIIYHIKINFIMYSDKGWFGSCSSSSRNWVEWFRSVKCITIRLKSNDWYECSYI